MSALFAGGLPSNHRDYELVKRLEGAILKHAHGTERFLQDIPQLLRQAIDEVIDTPRSNRFTLKEIEKTEKTYIGTKIEILLRNHLGMGKGKDLDLEIDGLQVDIKNTIGRNWTIPLEAIGHPCILLKADERKAICSFGIVVIRDEILNPGRNRDRKRTISLLGLGHIHWLLKNSPYPPNFWESLEAETMNEITKPRGGAGRVAALFRRFQGTPISRKIVIGLGQQEDPLRRIRRNGGARDILAPEGIAILWGKKDRSLIHYFCLPNCRDDEFISFKPTIAEDIFFLRKLRHID
jgi:restriction endonuclease NaeI